MKEAELKIKALEELGKIINEKANIQEVISGILDMIIDTFKVRSGSIILLDATGKEMEFSIARGEKAKELKEYKLKLGKGIAGKVAQTGVACIANDLKNHPDFNRKLAEKIGYVPEKILCVPIKCNKKILGVVEIMDKYDGSDFTKEDEQQLSSIGSTIGIMIENINLYKGMQENTIKLTKLIEMSKIINTTLNLRNLLEYIMESAKEVFGAEGSSLMFLDERKKELFFDITVGEGGKKLKQIRVPLGKGVAGIVAQTGKPLLIEDALNDPRVYKKADAITHFTTRNIMAVPMRVKDKIIGVLEVVNSKNKACFDEKDIEVFQAFADHAAVAIYNRELINNLEKANKELTRRLKEIKALHTISERTATETNPDKIFKIAIEIISEIFEIERISIMLWSSDEEALIIKEACGIPEEVKKRVKVKRGEKIAGKIFDMGEPVLVEDMRKDKRFGKHKRLRYKVPSFVSVPIKFRDKIIGVLNLTDKKNGNNFESDELMTFIAVSDQIGKSYENAIYYNEFLEKERLEKELEIAKQIQKHILPKEFKELTGIDAAGISIPAKEVGGDFYDYMKLKENLYGFLIADVSGKSLPAGMFMALARNILRVESFNLIEPAKVLEASNKYIYQDSESGMFVTLFYGVVNTAEKILKYGTGGHNPQLLFKKNRNEFVELKARGIPLGISPDSKYVEQDINIEKDDILLLYTDGVTEAINEKNEEFEVERLKNVIYKNKDKSSQDIINAVLDAIKEFTKGVPQFDDITLLVLKFK